MFERAEPFAGEYRSVELARRGWSEGTEGGEVGDDDMLLRIVRGTVIVSGHRRRELLELLDAGVGVRSREREGIDDSRERVWERNISPERPWQKEQKGQWGYRIWRDGALPRCEIEGTVDFTRSWLESALRIILYAAAKQEVQIRLKGAEEVLAIVGSSEMQMNVDTDRSLEMQTKR